jgi:hypothetical protein
MSLEIVVLIGEATVNVHAMSNPLSLLKKW